MVAGRSCFKTSSSGNAAWLERGEPAKAAVQFRGALRSRPDYVPAHYNLGEALRGLQQYDEAIHHFQRVVELDTTQLAARNNLGGLLAMRYSAELVAQQRRALDTGRNAVIKEFVGV